MKKHLAALLIIAGVFASYAPALRDGFVWDDTALILRDPLIRSWRLIPEGFNHFLFVDATASDFYRPLQRLTRDRGLSPASDAAAVLLPPTHSESHVWGLPESYLDAFANLYAAAFDDIVIRAAGIRAQ